MVTVKKNIEGTRKENCQVGFATGTYVRVFYVSGGERGDTETVILGFTEQ